MIDQQAIIQVAQEFSLPPAILIALSRQRGPGGLAFGLTTGHLIAAGLKPAEVAGNEVAQLELAARTLAQSFEMHGSWEPALSAYATGDPEAFQSPTGATGGFVYGTLGMASAQAEVGMEGYRPSNAEMFGRASSSFLDAMGEIHGSGGIVSTGHIKGYAAAANTAVQSARAYHARAATPIVGSTAPFDPQYDRVSQGFGPSSLEMEPAYGGYEHFHMGVDYEVAEGAPLRAIVGGKVHVNAGGWGGGNAITIEAPDGSTYLYGHDSDFAVNDGDTVVPGQVIAHAGSTGMSTGPHLHFEVRDPQGNLLDGDPLVQSAVQQARVHPQADMPHPELLASGQRSAAESRRNVLSQIDQVAQKLGVDPRLARAIAAQETGGSFDPAAVGDQGTSFGLYQLHQGGELGEHTPEWAANVVNNATTALTVVAQVQAQHPDWSPGQIAAAAQRPADPEGYAASVNQLFGDPSISDVVTGPAAPGQTGPTWRTEDIEARLQQLAAHPDPAAVGEFAGQLKGAGIDIDHFLQHYPIVAAMRHKMMQQPTTISDFVKYVGQSVQQIIQSIRGEPHPTYPDVTVGAFNDAAASAFMHSVNILGRTPTGAEASRFAAGGFGHRDIAAYYHSQAPQPPPQPPNATMSEQANSPRGVGDRWERDEPQQPPQQSQQHYYRGWGARW